MAKYKEPMVVVRPDAQDQSKDYLMAEWRAMKLYNEGKLARDLTNGGYCPILKLKDGEA